MVNKKTNKRNKKKTRKKQKGGIRINLSSRPATMKHLCDITHPGRSAHYCTNPPCELRPLSLRPGTCWKQASCATDCTLVSLYVMFGETEVIKNASKIYLASKAKAEHEGKRHAGINEHTVILLVKMILCELYLKKKGLWDQISKKIQDGLFISDKDPQSKGHLLLWHKFIYGDDVKLDENGSVLNSSARKYPIESIHEDLTMFGSGFHFVCSYITARFEDLWSLEIENKIFKVGGLAYSAPAKIDAIINKFVENILPGKMAYITIGNYDGHVHATVIGRLDDDIEDRENYTTDGLYILEEQSCSYRDFNCDIIPIKVWLEKLIFNVKLGQDILTAANKGMFGNVAGGNTKIKILNITRMRDERMLNMNFPLKDVFYRDSAASGAGGAGESKESSFYFGGRKKKRGSGKRKRYDILTNKIKNLNTKIETLKTKIRDIPNPEEKEEIEFTIDHLLKKMNTMKKTISRKRTARKKKTKKRRKRKKK
uniref:Uncharacterized protein n=1 Tax=viral metagenome TaxID=1070528 RepID=A0A6C0BYU9_9ZZZZ